MRLEPGPSSSNGLRCERSSVVLFTEHPTAEAKVYLAAVIDAHSRRAVGWSIADHMRAELVADALQMATWRRRPEPGAIAYSDHEAWYNPHRRHSYCDYLSPIDYETANAA